MTYEEWAVENYIDTKLRRFEEELVREMEPRFAPIRAAHLQVYLHCFDPRFPDKGHEAAMGHADRYTDERMNRIYETIIDPAMKEKRDALRALVDMRKQAGQPIEEWP